MSQHDFTIDNQTFPATRSDINSALQALASLSSGASAPSTTFAYQLWVNTTTDPNILNVRNSANNAWIKIGEVNQGSAAFILTAYAILQAGSAAAPSHSFDADRDTGMYSAAANIIGFATNGTERVRIDSSGNVGIGETNPTRKLDVVGTASATYFMMSSNTASAPAVDAAITRPANGALAVITNSAERMRINSSGNVGIGTTANYRLAVVGGATQLSGSTEAAAGLRVQSSAGVATLSGINSDNNAYNPIALYTGNTESMTIDTSGYMSGAVNGLGSGRIPAMQYYRLNSGVTGANNTSAQSIFGVGVTLVGATQYEFELYAVLNKTVGATSHYIATGFGGTATLNNILYTTTVPFGSGSLPVPSSTLSNNMYGSISNTATATNSVGTISNATANASLFIKGTVSVNAGGTFIPQYTLSAAPGGAYTTQIGSYFRIFPLAASGSAVNIGTWA